MKTIFDVEDKLHADERRDHEREVARDKPRQRRAAARDRALHAARPKGTAPVASHAQRAKMREMGRIVYELEMRCVTRLAGRNTLIAYREKRQQEKSKIERTLPLLRSKAHRAEARGESDSIDAQDLADAKNAIQSFDEDIAHASEELERIAAIAESEVAVLAPMRDTLQAALAYFRLQPGDLGINFEWLQ